MNDSIQFLDIPRTGFLRLRQIVGDAKARPPIPPIIPVGKSTWWAGVKSGRYPQPVRTLGTRITAWKAEDISQLIQTLSEHENNEEKEKEND